MTERPINFTAPMVRAILEGRKSQHRVMLKLPKKTFSGGPIYENPKLGGWEPTTNGGGGCFAFVNGRKVEVPETVGLWHKTTGVCMDAPVQGGDTLWVREAFRAEELSRPSFTRKATREEREILKRTEVIVHDENDGIDVYRYLADNAWRIIASTQVSGDQWSDLYWRGKGPVSDGIGPKISPIHMPRWASRITLRVTDVRVERLQDISEADAIAEGLQAGTFPGQWRNPSDLSMDHQPAVTAYKALWDSINGPGAWDANPWVVALTFERIAHD